MRDDRHPWPSAGAMAALAAICLTGAVQAHAQTFLATSERPAVIPVVRPEGSAAAASSFRYVDITVRGFQPSSHGPVQIVVEAPGRRAPVEIGRFGIYPERRFSAAQPDQAQHFGLELPRGLRLSEAARLTVRLVPDGGSAEGASADVAVGRLR